MPQVTQLGQQVKVGDFVLVYSIYTGKVRSIDGQKAVVEIFKEEQRLIKTQNITEPTSNMIVIQPTEELHDQYEAMKLRRIIDGEVAYYKDMLAVERDKARNIAKMPKTFTEEWTHDFALFYCQDAGETIGIAQRRKIKFVYYTIGNMVNELPPEMKYEMNVWLAALFDNSSHKLESFAMLNRNFKPIKSFHTGNYNICLGDRDDIAGKVKIEDAQSIKWAFDEIQELLKTINPSSPLTSHNFSTRKLQDIWTFVERQYREYLNHDEMCGNCDLPLDECECDRCGCGNDCSRCDGCNNFLCECDRCTDCENHDCLRCGECEIRRCWDEWMTCERCDNHTCDCTCEDR